MSTFLLARINCSISDKKRHYTNSRVMELFDKKESDYNKDDLFILSQIKEEVIVPEFDFFCKYNKISPQKAEYVKRIIGF